MYNIDQLKTTQTFFLPIYNYATMIERQYGEFLMPIQTGIYKVGEMFPCIYPNRKYFAQKILKGNHYVSVPIDDFNKVTDSVIDEAGNLIIHSSIMKNKEQYLRNEPTVPVRGLIIVELLIKRYIDSISPWVKGSMHNNKITAQLKPESVDLFLEGHLEKICESLFMQVGDFIGNDNWHVYFVKFAGLDLIIEKSNDYRILVYHQKVDNGEW